MGSTIGGDDPLHELPDDKKRAEEKRIRSDAAKKFPHDIKKRNKENNRAKEISRKKARRAHQ